MLIHEIASGSVTTSMNRSTVKSRFLFFKLSKCQSKLCQQYQQDHQEHMIWWRDMVIGTGGRKGTNKMQFRFFFAVHVWLFASDFLAALMNFVLLASKGRIFITESCHDYMSNHFWRKRENILIHKSNHNHSRGLLLLFLTQ